MTWATVNAAIKLWNRNGPSTINGISVSSAYPNANDFPNEGLIRDTIHDLYVNSPTAAAILEQGAQTRDIWLVNISGAGSSKSAGHMSGTVGIDLTSVQTFKWMGSDGRLQSERLGGNIIHELIHAITGKPDLVDPHTNAELFGAPRDYNDRDFDHLGETVEKQNVIFQEMASFWGVGAGYQQVGYDAILTPSNSLYLRTDITDFSYTEGNTIDIAYF